MIVLLSMIFFIQFAKKVINIRICIPNFVLKLSTLYASIVFPSIFFHGLPIIASPILSNIDRRNTADTTGSYVLPDTR